MPILKSVFALALLTTVAIPVAPVAARDDAVVAYGCSDLVMIGRLATVDHTNLANDDYLLGRTRYAMRVRIKQRLRGDDRRATVPATGVAHAPLRSDRDFLLVLTPNDEQGYTLRSADLRRNGAWPRLAPSCE